MRQKQKPGRDPVRAGFPGLPRRVRRRFRPTAPPHSESHHVKTPRSHQDRQTRPGALLSREPEDRPSENTDAGEVPGKNPTPRDVHRSPPGIEATRRDSGPPRKRSEPHCISALITGAIGKPSVRHGKEMKPHQRKTDQQTTQQPVGPFEPVGCRQPAFEPPAEPDAAGQPHSHQGHRKNRPGVFDQREHPPQIPLHVPPGQLQRQGEKGGEQRHDEAADARIEGAPEALLVAQVAKAARTLPAAPDPLIPVLWPTTRTAHRSVLPAHPGRWVRLRQPSFFRHAGQ